MATQNEKLATSLQVLRDLPTAGVRVLQVSKHPSLTRVHRERLVKAGFMKPVILGWYLLSRPEERDGDSTSWHINMEAFVADYANSRFDRDWQLSPEQSLLRHSGETTLPKQTHIHAPKANNDVVPLPHGCSLLLYRGPKALQNPNPVVNANGLRLAPLEESLFRVAASFYALQPQAAQIALRRADINELARLVLKDGSTTVAGRLVGALRAVERDDDAQLLLRTMRAAGHALRVVNPFVAELRTIAGDRTESPYVQRIRMMWSDMRAPVIAAFKGVPIRMNQDIDTVLADAQARYFADAYNSLSIEGYRVTEQLIEKVRNGDWRPDFNESDRQVRDAMAAKGYFEAHRTVLGLIRETLQSKASAGERLRKNLASWHLALFSPSVTAGILTAQDLAGYRNRPVFISGASHVPLPAEAVRECMPLLLQLLEQEESPAVRAVLGHFVFVYIHPYIDGNGRLGRFVMNFMLATGGYVWTVVPVQQRVEYMAVLEQASTSRNIGPFAGMLARLVSEQAATPLSRASQRED